LTYTNVSEECAALYFRVEVCRVKKRAISSQFTIPFPSYDKRCKGPEKGLLLAYHCSSPDQVPLILVLGGHLSIPPSTRDDVRALQRSRTMLIKALLMSFCTNYAEPIAWLGIDRAYGRRITPPVHVCCTWNFQDDPYYVCALSMYSGQSASLLPDCTVSCLRSVGP
jgi:hypothetical protein